MHRADEDDVHARARVRVVGVWRRLRTDTGRGGSEEEEGGWRRRWREGGRGGASPGGEGRRGAARVPGRSAPPPARRASAPSLVTRATHAGDAARAVQPGEAGGETGAAAPRHATSRSEIACLQVWPSHRDCAVSRRHVGSRVTGIQPRTRGARSRCTTSRARARCRPRRRSPCALSRPLRPFARCLARRTAVAVRDGTPGWPSVPRPLGARDPLARPSSRAERRPPAERAPRVPRAPPASRDVRAFAENDGRGPNPNEVDGPTFGGEMVGVGIFLFVAFQFFVLAFVDFPFQVR